MPMKMEHAAHKHLLEVDFACASERACHFDEL